MNLFRKVQIKFMLIPVCACAVLLLGVFAAIYLVSDSSAERYAQESIDKELGRTRGFELAQPYENGEIEIDRIGRCMVIEVIDGIAYRTHFEFLSEEDAAALERAVLNSDSDRVEVGGREYRFGKADLPDRTKYAIYDFTASARHIHALTVTLAIIYVVTISAIAALCYGFSRSAVQPLKIAFDQQKNLVANASHELKTPLTIACANLDLVRSDPSLSVADNAKWLAGASYQLERMNSLVLQMLELSAIDDKRVNKNEWVDVSTLCQGVLLSFEGALFERSIELQSYVDEGVRCFCDKIELEKVVTILLDNAKKYTSQGGLIDFSLTKTLRHIEISVSNTGKGIPKDQLDKVFDRFYKADPAHRENGNSFGLGLSIAKSIVESMSGEIICTSEYGKKTTFKVLLPVTRKIPRTTGKRS